MNAKKLGAIAVVLVCAGAFSQQPNSPFASMTINGAVGAPYPLSTNILTGTQAVFAIGAQFAQPYAIFQSPTLAVGSAAIPANNSFNIVDLPLNPFPALVIDGFTYPTLFSTNAAGVGGFTIAVPPTGTPPTGIPVGLTLALQGVVADPFSTVGATLTAATLCTVFQGPIVTPLNLSNNGQFTVNVAANPIPYYG